MDGIKSIIDLWTTIFLNVYNCYRNNGGIFFFVSIAVVVIFPLFRRIIRSIRGGR